MVQPDEDEVVTLQPRRYASLPNAPSRHMAAMPSPMHPATRN